MAGGRSMKTLNTNDITFNLPRIRIESTSKELGSHTKGNVSQVVIRNLDDPYGNINQSALNYNTGSSKFVTNKIPLKANYRTDSTLKSTKALPRAHASLLDRYVNETMPNV